MIHLCLNLEYETEQYGAEDIPCTRQEDIMGDTVKKIRQVCTCENCGNEAEMIITCTLEPIPENSAESTDDQHAKPEETKQRVKGSGTCTQCGNEADIWVDI